MSRISLLALSGLLASGCQSRVPNALDLARPSPTFGGPRIVREGATSPRQAPAIPDLSGPLRLEVLLPLLIARNPGIEAAHARLEAATHRYPQAIALPDPMVEGTYFARNAMAGERDYARYELMVRQEIPFPLKLRLKGCQVAKEVEAEAFRYEAVVRDAVADLKEVHAERAYLAAAALVQQAVHDVYQRYAELARADSTTGRTNLAESFRAEALLSQSVYDGQVLEEMKAVEDERLRALLMLPPSVVLGEPADAGAITPVAADPADLARRAEAYNQELHAAGAEAEAADLAMRKAQLTYVPNLTLGAGHMVNDDFDPMGRLRDSDVLTLGVTIPIGPGHSAEIREAEANLRAARSAEVAERMRLRREVSKAAFRLRNAERLADLYGKSLVPQAEQALLRSEEMVKTEKETLASSLELAATWQQLRMAHLRAIADHAQALAALERLLGTSAVLIPAEVHK